MKKQLFAVLAAAFLIQSCTEIMGGTKGKGSVEKFMRSETGFTGVDMQCSADVFVKQATDFKIVVEGQKNIVDLLQMSVEKGVLKVYFKDNIGNISYDKLNIYVEAPNFENLIVSGSGDIRADELLSSKDLNLSVSGSGNIDIKNMTSEKVLAEVGGSGNIKLNGTTQSAKLGISGSGNIVAKSLSAKTVDASVSGSGNIKCSAETNLEGEISGSGDIRYAGSPSVKSRVTGSGSIEKE